MCAAQSTWLHSNTPPFSLILPNDFIVTSIPNAADFAQIFQVGKKTKQKYHAWNIMYPNEPSSLSLQLNVYFKKKMHGNWTRAGLYCSTVTVPNWFLFVQLQYCKEIIKEINHIYCNNWDLCQELKSFKVFSIVHVDILCDNIVSKRTNVSIVAFHHYPSQFIWFTQESTYNYN